MSPMFFISGYFTKIDENVEIKSFKGILIPYILFATLWILFKLFVFDSTLPKNPYFVQLEDYGICSYYFG